ncbi:enoyl-CoA hydratase/isomerase family protein [Desertibacillus haloalkaliphilus]|uniref:enoyl-CoA hydratase/isomerase family protein n=1 Tax=Desertibacillus haloalkaliphilus TaxID=1328930 RepID=UPI001C27F7E3|nr:enoyl-CoA hydratase-related protein [Desertibacillus haloalkaliphilus]MBU8906228.1 enoyl-CoA hydratase/isomerase family protein [Desertibacillus haloalkaliphilus]
MSEAVLLHVNEGVAKITLNRPEKLNVLSNEIIAGLRDALQEVKSNSAIRAVIITGNGKGFCAGGDITSFPKGYDNASVGRDYMKFGLPLITDLAQLEKPVIAAVNGYAVGAGFSLALACDFVIATEQSSFAMVFNKIGLIPDLGGLYHLPRMVGMARAKELVFSGRTISAKEAKKYGIVLDIVQNQELITKAEELATSLGTKATQAIGLAKFMLNRSFESSLEQMLREEALVQSVAFSTEDHDEGVRAFFEKRDPNFLGK